ncbi:glycoside hydrolase [Aspergillus carlsbadensis]|nr:glycoside hydrolase [Aspergillus carlsbadensis]
MKLSSIFGALCSLPVLSHAAPSSSLHEARQSTDRLVFAHFMVGICANRVSAADYDDDMKRAKSMGIDAFALNIGTDAYSEEQLDFAYESAANNDMKVFISFDFNWYSTSQGTLVGQKVAKYAGLPAQLIVDGKVFVSTFVGDGVDVNGIRSAAGQPIFFAPNFHPEQGTDMSQVDGLFNWMAWDSNGRNKAPKPGELVTVQQESSLTCTPVSPWFFTHFGPEVSYSKNWVFPGDLQLLTGAVLWYDRWQEMLALGPRFIEIITWNEYGESHYIGPLSSPHTDDGASKWVNDMQPFIAAYKDGAISVDNYITEDRLVYWYRPAPRNVNCDVTDTCMLPANNNSGNYFYGRPDGWETLEDAVFVVTTLTEPATVTVNSGGNIHVFEAPAGASAFKVPMGVGSQAFSISRYGQVIQSGVSLKPIIDGCAFVERRGT